MTEGYIYLSVWFSRLVVIIISTDGRQKARIERHLWVLQWVKEHEGFSRADLIRAIFMQQGVSAQVCRDDVNDLAKVGLIAVGVDGAPRKESDRVMTTKEGHKWLKQKVSEVEAHGKDSKRSERGEESVKAAR